MQANSYDALIVGGGPAGSTCARALVQAGLRVLVMDKRPFPRDKVCAGWITPAVVRTLNLDTEDYRRRNVFQPITRFRVGRIGDKPVMLDYAKPVSFGIRRCEFDNYLLQRSGAELCLGHSVLSIERRDGRWLINGEIDAGLLVGAGGHFCPVARHLGATPGKSERSVTAQEIEFQLSDAQRAQCSVEGERPELYFCPDLAGYGWCFRKGDYLNVGLGREDSDDLAGHVQRFLDWLIDTGRVPRDTPRRFHGHAYILYGHTQRKLFDDGVLLIGDAAGLAYPQSGEGIRTAVESALLAARTVLAADGAYAAPQLAPYAHALRKRFGKPGSGAGLSGLLPAALSQGLAGWLLKKPWFARRVVLDRWFLHAGGKAMAER